MTRLKEFADRKLAVISETWDDDTELSCRAVGMFSYSDGPDDEGFIVAGQEQSGMRFPPGAVESVEVEESLVDAKPLDEVVGIAFVTVILRDKTKFSLQRLFIQAGQ